jgi:hypothetical protein
MNVIIHYTVLLMHNAHTCSTVSFFFLPYSKLLKNVIFFLLLRFYLDLRSVQDCRPVQNGVSRIERQPNTTFPTEPTVFPDSHAAYDLLNTKVQTSEQS